MSQWLGQQERAPDRWESTRGAAMAAVGPGVKGIHPSTEKQREWAGRWSLEAVEKRWKRKDKRGIKRF